MFFNSANKTVLRIMTPVTVFVNVWEFQVINCDEVSRSYSVFNSAGAAEFHIASNHI
jgi:hypothetical protein